MGFMNGITSGGSFYLLKQSIFLAWKLGGRLLSRYNTKTLNQGSLYILVFRSGFIISLKEL